MQSDIRIDGRVFAYVFPCAWEDYAKIGFSRDPLGRISALHRRWFEFFDLEAGALVEAESERDARDLELQLRAPFKAHRAPAPMTVQDKAGGRTEWVRGANQALAVAIDGLGEQGYRCYPLKPWLRAALQLRMDRLHDWAAAQLPQEEGLRMPGGPGEVALRDTLDGYRALEIDPLPWLPDHVQRWYAG
ncbi:GIY-YIG nuclease family protein [Stenotrophomonas tuberculopleuritidis]|uniref:GIY-YIG nuclease family protein n=1 Tax=Stenotrophomonas tuberculopleuritidis TaxID=3055079 RepID=UPI0026E543EF|nr:GIY-YIG nuclease family protein [Stenotrophomonas sp. 704A1]